MSARDQITPTPAPAGVSLGSKSNYTNVSTSVEFDELPLSPLAAPVLLTVVHGRRSVAGIRDDLFGVFDEDVSAGVVVAELRWSLRRHGLVDWTDGRHGTIRPLVEVVQVASRSDVASVGHTAPDGGERTPGPRARPTTTHRGKR